MDSDDACTLTTNRFFDKETIDGYLQVNRFFHYIIRNEANPAVHPLMAKILNHFFYPDSSRNVRIRCFNTMNTLTRMEKNIEDENVKKKTRSLLNIFVTKYMTNAFKNKEDLITASIEPELKVQALSVLPCILNMKAQNVGWALDRLFCLQDRKSDVHKRFVHLLMQMLKTETQKVILWLNVLEFDDIRTKYIHWIVPAVFSTPGIDIPKVFFVTPDIRRQSLKWLDSQILIKNSQASSALKQLLLRMTTNDLRKKIVEYAKVFDDSELLSIIPNTIAERRAVDMQQKIGSFKTDVEKFDFIKQMMESNNVKPSMFSRVAIQDAELLAAALKACNIEDSEIQKAVGKKLIEARSSQSYRQRLKLFEEHASSDGIAAQFYKVTADIKPELKFPNNQLCVYFINDKEKVEFFISKLWEVTKIGFDVEGSYVCQSAKSSVEASVLQISVGYDVYVLDLFRLQKLLTPTHWSTLWFQFCRRDIMRIGFDVRQDVLMLQSVPGFKQQLEKTGCDFQCLKIFMENISQEAQEIKEKVVKDGFEKYSLSYIVGKLLGEKMDKGGQCTNWQKRPILPKDLIYAAKDAVFTQLAFNILKNKIKKAAADLPHLTIRVSSSLNEKLAAIENSMPKDLDASVSVVTPIIGGKKKKLKFHRNETISAIINLRNELLIALGNEHPQDPKELIIVVHRRFHSSVPLLRQIGFQVWDYRMRVPDPSISIHQEYEVLRSLISEVRPDREKLFFLTKFDIGCTIKSCFNPEHIINYMPLIHEPAYKVIERVLRETRVVIDDSILRNCVQCGSSEHTVDIPVVVCKAIGYYDLKMKEQLSYKNLPDNAPETAINAAAETNPEWHFDENEKTYKSNDIEFTVTNQGILVKVGEIDSHKINFNKLDYSNPRCVDNFIMCTKCPAIF